MSEQVPLAGLRLDEELQPRAAIDRTVLENYVQLLVDGARFPPVVAFHDGDALWLADGFHRWHAHAVIQADTIDVDIREGTWRDALMHSLAANSRHGLQRGATDYKRAYEIACRNALVDDPLDSEAVATLLHCSVSWAEKLTAPAREAAKAKRDAEIVRLKGEGKTVREIAQETGVPRATVGRVPNPHSAEMGQTAARPDPNAAAKQMLQELATPEAMAWSAALRALRQITEQPSVDELFHARYTGYDHEVGPALDAALDWITDMHRRFDGERHQRRRA